jgi:formiminotetrahydrofolate cyclodeaminase
MHDQTIGAWLEDLGSSKPAPGGGAAAALLVATGAALVEMVTNLTIGKPRYAEHEQLMVTARSEARTVREQALALAAQDEDAFNAVVAAYRIPKDDPGRSDAIQIATAGAAEPPLQTAALAAEVIALAGRIRSGANVNLLSDVAVAASSAKAALESAAVNVEVNTAALHDPGTLNERLTAYLPATEEAENIIALVRAATSR